MLSRRFAGGSLKVVAAKAPRNLRRHTARVLLVDEADAMVPGPEGSPLILAERRTLSFADRKIVIGSTPLDAETSNVLRAYAASRHAHLRGAVSRVRRLRRDPVARTSNGRRAARRTRPTAARTAKS